MSKPMHSNLIDEDRSVKVRGIIRRAPALCSWVTKTSKKSLVNPQKWKYNLCCRECRYHLIVRIGIVADGLYFSPCSPPWKLKVIRELTRKKCWIFKTNDWYCSDNKNHNLWTPPSCTEDPPAKIVVDEMQWNPTLSLNTNIRIKRMVRLYRQKLQMFSLAIS